MIGVLSAHLVSFKKCSVFNLHAAAIFSYPKTYIDLDLHWCVRVFFFLGDTQPTGFNKEGINFYLWLDGNTEECKVEVSVFLFLELLNCFPIPTFGIFCYKRTSLLFPSASLSQNYSFFSQTSSL